MAKRGRVVMDDLFGIDTGITREFSKWLILGSKHLRMHYKDRRSMEILSRPFSNLEKEYEKLKAGQEKEELNPDLEIFVLHDSQGEGFLSLWEKFEEDSSEEKKLLMYNKEGIHLLYNHESKVLTGYDRKSKRAYYYIPSLEMLPYYEKAAPMRMIFHHFSEENSMTLVHGASVSIDGKGILLIGRGGSGKTTTAIAAALKGFEYLGDDYVILDMNEKSILNLYSSSKIRWKADEIVPGLEALAINSRNEDKGYFFMEDSGGKIRAKSSLAAVVIPKIGQGDTSYQRISSAKALLILASSTIFQMPGSGNKTLKDISHILKDIPVFEMELGRDIEDTNSKLEEIIKGL